MTFREFYEAACCIPGVGLSSAMQGVGIVNTCGSAVVVKTPGIAMKGDDVCYITFEVWVSKSEVKFLEKTLRVPVERADAGSAIKRKIRYARFTTTTNPEHALEILHAIVPFIRSEHDHPEPPF